MLRQERSLQTDQSWKAGMLQCETVQVFVTRDGHSCCVFLFFCSPQNSVQTKLCKMDVVFRRLLRSIVGQHGDVDWNLLWHENPHH